MPEPENLFQRGNARGTTPRESYIRGSISVLQVCPIACARATNGNWSIMLTAGVDATGEKIKEELEGEHD